jgi:uncharacterized SAM-binding protein YcdF (DUF218 family)
MIAFLKHADFLLLVLLSITALSLFLLWVRRGSVAVLWGTTMSFCCLMLVASPIAFQSCTAHLEQQYPPIVHVKTLEMPSESIKYVVVLGASSTSNPDWPITSQLGAVTLTRVIEGVRILKQLPDAVLVLSGGGPPGFPESALMEKMVVALGVEPHRIFRESESRSTYEEAVLMKPVLQSQPFILVTSARHMPRAMAIFMKQELSPIPAPVGHSVNPSIGASWVDFIPRFSHAARLNDTLYEYLGFLKAYFTNTV